MFMGLIEEFFLGFLPIDGQFVSIVAHHFNIRYVKLFFEFHPFKVSFPHSSLLRYDMAMPFFALSVRLFLWNNL